MDSPTSKSDNKSFKSVDEMTKTFDTLFTKIGDTVYKQGVKKAAVISGITISALILIKNSVPAATKGNPSDIYIYAGAVLFVIAGLLFSSLEYRWFNNAKLREQELLLERYKLELDYNVKRLNLTDPKTLQPSEVVSGIVPGQ